MGAISTVLPAQNRCKMIELSRWGAFLAASLLIGALPGPGVANIVGFALTSGRKTAFAAIGGAVAGNVIAMLMSLAGVGALVEAFPLARKSVELAGAAYLIALGLIGISRTRTAVSAGEVPRAPILASTAFVGSIAVSALNPKSIIFFIVFVPQFIAPDKSFLGQASILVVTFASIVAFSDTLYRCWRYVSRAR